MQINKIPLYLNHVKKEVFKQLSLSTGLVLNKPQFIGIEVEDRCCLQCKHCDLWKISSRKKKLNLSQHKKLLVDLKSWLGSAEINFDGGEPFLNKNIMDLLVFADELGLKINITTNGYLIDDNKAEKIIKSNLNCLTVSLDSLKASVHDWLRGVNGTYDQVQNAITILNYLRKKHKSKMLLTINTVLLKQNFKEIIKMVHWVKNNGLDGISFQPIDENFGKTCHQSQWFKESGFWPEQKVVSRVIPELIKLKKTGYPIFNSVKHLKMIKDYFINPEGFWRAYPCRVGLSNFLVDLCGNVRLCYLMQSCGNILNSSLGQIWNSEQANKQRELIKKCQKNCRLLLCNQKKLLSNYISTRFYKLINNLNGKI